MQTDHPTSAHERHRKHTAISGSRRSLSASLAEQWTYRELLYFFVWRDVKIRYKQSVVGVGWSILQPLALMLVFTLFFGRVAHVSTSSLPRPLFYFAGLLPWTYFQQALSNSSNSLVTNTQLVGKVYFPRVMLPISSVLSSLVDFAISLPMLVGLAVIYVLRDTPHVRLGFRMLFLVVPITLMIASVLALGIWLSALNARYRDVRYAVPFALQFWLFVSPIAYPTSAIPARWRVLYDINPIADVADGFRWAFTDHAIQLTYGFILASVLVTFGIFFGLRSFRKWEGTVADVI